MVKNRTSFWKAIPLALLMSLGIGKAEECKESSLLPSNNYNYIYSANPNFTVSGEGIFGKKYVNELELTPNSEENLGDLLYAKKGKLEFRVMDAKEGLNNAFAYLNKPCKNNESFEQYKKELVNYVTNNPSDSSSLVLLNNAIKDGIFSTIEDSLYSHGKWNIKDGVYMLLAKSPEIDSLKAQSVPILFQINTSGKKENISLSDFNLYIKNLGELESCLKDVKYVGKSGVRDSSIVDSSLYSNKLEKGFEKRNKTLDKLKKMEDSNFVSTEIDSPYTDIKEIKDFSKFLEFVGQQNGEAKLPNLYVIGGINGNLNSIEGKFGIAYGPLAFLGSYGRRADERVSEITTTSSPLTGRYGYGTEDNKNISNSGLALEYVLQSNGKIATFVGAGANFWKYDREITEEIRNSEDETLVSNTNSVVGSDISGKFYGGVRFPVGKRKNNDVGVFLGYDTKNKFFLGADYVFKLK